MKIANKVLRLENILKEAKKIIVAYSGGVDSTFLLKKAVDVLGNQNVLAVTAKSEVLPEDDYKSAVENSDKIGANLRIIKTCELENPLFSSNPTDRCYHCKKELFTKLKEISSETGIDYLADGFTVSDLTDYRPGEKAVEEFDGNSPLLEAGLTKEEIRILSKEMSLATWDKPSSPCLASRIPYGNEITSEILNKISEAEKIVKNFGVKQLRVRHIDHTARIEVDPLEIQTVIGHKDEISQKLKSLGYIYVSVDLDGYKEGSLNKVVSQK